MRMRPPWALILPMGPHASHASSYVSALIRIGPHTRPLSLLCGRAARACVQVRIPRMTEKDNKGYFEDRRPASNMDPYIVTGKIMETCVLPDC